MYPCSSKRRKGTWRLERITGRITVPWQSWCMCMRGLSRKLQRVKGISWSIPIIFSGVYDGADNAKLWDEVYAYLDSHYDLKKVKKIYLNADGGTWIQSGKKRIAGITSVLDEFHLQKYLLKMTSHLKDSVDDARKELCDAIKRGTKADFQSVVEGLKVCAETEATEKRIEESGAYILSNWTAAKIRLKDRETVKGCSAEGHVSHVLSSRMSSRPMGWSRTGVDKIGRNCERKRNQ